MEWINIILLVIALIVHELGHYVAYRLIGKKPNIRFKWYGINIGENIWHSLRPFEAYIVSIIHSRPGPGRIYIDDYNPRATE